MKQDFKVIGVAANYLLDDPESLGHAAVIEWLNPKENSDQEFEKQIQNSKLFLSGEKFVPQHLQKELRHLVRKATSALGKAILELEGEAFFKKVESYREISKKARLAHNSNNALKTLSKKLKFH